MPEVSAGSSPLQEEVGDGLVQIGEDQASLSEPSIEGVQEPQPLLHGFTGITQLGEVRDERVQVRAEQASPESFDGGAVPEEVLKHEPSP